MENATKALTIAGGVLIAIIVISTLLYSFHRWGLFPSAQDKNKEQNQLAEFNNRFESYKKQNLYGTDVITVINMAMANNEKYGITAKIDDPYYVDVQITVRFPANGKKIIKTYSLDSPDPTVPKEEEVVGYTNGNIGVKISPPYYSLKNDLFKLKDLCTASPIEETTKKNGADIVKTQCYSANEEFKLKYFTCTGIDYKDGRVSVIKFREVNSDTTAGEIHKIG